MSGGSNPYLGRSNPYLQQNIDNVNNDVVRAYNQTAVPGQITAGIKSGSFGNSGLQQMQLQDQQNLQKTLANNASQMRGADYNQQQGMYQWQKQFDLGAQNQGFNQGLAADQNRYNQNMGWANYGLGAQNQLFNQGMAKNQFDANQYWTGQNFDAGRYDTTFNQNQQQFNNYLNLMNQANSNNQGDISNATNIYNTPLNYQSAFGNMATQYGGLGGSSSQTLPGNQFLGGLGGYSIASKLGGSK